MSTAVPSYTTLLVDVADGVATVWLHRPEQRNAFDITMIDELHEALAVLERDDEVRAIVVTGSGRFFSSGADLSSGALPGGDPAESSVNRAKSRWIRPWEMRTPVIAAINGPAVGIGLTLPLTWDVRYAAHDAKLAFLFTRRGVSPEWGSLWMVPRMVGLSRCMDLMLSGQFFSGREACARGIVTQTFDPDDVLPAAQALAREIADNTSPAAVATTKLALYKYLQSADRDAAFRSEQDAFLWLSQQPDAEEGPAAFLEKRPPHWQSSKNCELPPGL